MYRFMTNPVQSNWSIEEIRRNRKALYILHFAVVCRSFNVCRVTKYSCNLYFGMHETGVFIHF
uniref:Uncharacterized protein n=1 Tax=Zea mays TaxID=4577 RepID=B6SQQ4_MAIZE|nr:hypothetical protein [Zea mays]ACG43289.1 hypothetical protein [Zea mays]